MRFIFGDTLYSYIDVFKGRERADYTYAAGFFRLFPSFFFMLTTFLRKTLFSENVFFLCYHHIVLITIVFTQPSSLLAVYCQIGILLGGIFSYVHGFYVSC
jgi:hypothetical protein